MKAKLVVLAVACCIVLVGCRKNASSGGAANKIRVGYIGLTCEAPIFSAVEKGFFREEGLEVELVKCEWANYKDVLALGGYDITHHLVIYFLKPIRAGSTWFTAGIHKAVTSPGLDQGKHPDDQYARETDRRARDGNATYLREPSPGRESMRART